MSSDGVLNKNIVFHSERIYPSIVRSGKKSYSIGSSPSTITITSIGPDETFSLVDVHGGRIYGSRRETLAYVEGGNIKVYFENYASRTGTIEWRIYGDRH